jgi:hypothetical protein
LGLGALVCGDRFNESDARPGIEGRSSIANKNIHIVRVLLERADPGAIWARLALLSLKAALRHVDGLPERVVIRWDALQARRGRASHLAATVNARLR